MNSPEVYETPDLYQASYLKSFDIELTETRHEGSRTFFIFTKTKDLQEKVYNYLHDPWIRKFIHAIKDNKFLIYHPTEI